MRGGKREGSGRPTKNKLAYSVTLRLTKEQMEWYAETPDGAQRVRDMIDMRIELTDWTPKQ